MIILNVTDEMKTALSDALRNCANDSTITLGISKRDIRENAPVVIAQIIDVWPPEIGGSYKLAFNDVAVLIAYRALILSEIVAGRGLKRDKKYYETNLGIEFSNAKSYVKALGKKHGFRPVSGERWSIGAEWVAVDGCQSEPRGKWSRSAWRTRAKAHENSVLAGLAVTGRNIWDPRATMLWLEPVKYVPRNVLADEDLAALEALAA